MLYMTGHKITNTNKNNIHIHVGDKAKKRRKNRKSKRVIYPQQAYTSSHPALPLFNRPQSLDTTLGDDRERIRQNPLAGLFQNPVPTNSKPEAFKSPVPASAPKNEFSTQTPAKIKKEFKNAEANTAYEANDSSSQTSEQMESVRDNNWRRQQERVNEDFERMKRQRDSGMQTKSHPATSTHTQTFANAHHHIDTQTPSSQASHTAAQTDFEDPIPPSTNSTVFREESGTNTGPIIPHRHGPFTSIAAPAPQRIGPFTSHVPASGHRRGPFSSDTTSDTTDQSPNKIPKSHREFDITHALRTKKNPPK